MQLSNKMLRERSSIPNIVVHEVYGTLMIIKHLYQVLWLCIGGAALDIFCHDTFFNQSFRDAAI